MALLFSSFSSYPSPPAQRRQTVVSGGLCSVLALRYASGSDLPPLLTLSLERHEPPCRLAAFDRHFVDLQPLLLERIQPVASDTLPRVQYIAKGALRVGWGGPVNLLLDSHVADLWLMGDAAPPDAGGALDLLDLLHRGGGGCGAAQGESKETVLRLTGVPSFADIWLAALPAEAHIAKQAVIAARSAEPADLASIQSFQGILGVNRGKFVRAGPPLTWSLSHRSVSPLMTLSPGSGQSSLTLALGSDLGSVCESEVFWEKAQDVSGLAASNWAVSLTATAGTRGEIHRWNGIAAIDISSGFLRLPASELSLFFNALLGQELASRCLQSSPKVAERLAGTAAAGLLFCPCADTAARPPARLALGALEWPLPWSGLLEPVEGEPGLCLLRVHGAALGEMPSVGATILLLSRALILDFGGDRAGVCVPLSMGSSASGSSGSSASSALIAGAASSGPLILRRSVFGVPTLVAGLGGLGASALASFAMCPRLRRRIWRIISCGRRRTRSRWRSCSSSVSQDSGGDGSDAGSDHCLGPLE